LMNEMYDLMVLNAEAEGHADDLFIQLRRLIEATEMTRAQFKKKITMIKYSICKGRKYTDQIGPDTVSFENVLELYEAGKKKLTGKKKKTDSEKVQMARVQEVRTRMLAAADSMYRRWLAKLFPVEAQAVVVNMSGLGEVALVTTDGHRSDDDGNDAAGGDGSGSTEDDEASDNGDDEIDKRAAKGDVDHDDDGSDAGGGDGSGSSEDDEASGTDDVEAAAKGDVDQVHRRSANKRPVVQTTRYEPGDQQQVSRKSSKRVRSGSSLPPSKKQAKESAPQEEIDNTDKSVTIMPPASHIILIETADEPNLDPTQDYEDFLIRIPRKQDRVVNKSELGAYLNEYKWD
jgi:hypothetical protein